MRTVNVLLAEKDVNLGPILKTFLDQNDFPTTLVLDGESALKVYSSDEIDLVVLGDINQTLSFVDKYAVLEKIRDLDPKIPILVISDKVDEKDVIKGFNLGCDDYLRKPLAMEEMLCRIKAIARRSMMNKPEDDIFKIGDYYVFDYARRIVNFKGTKQAPKKEIKLTGKEAELLKMFCLSMNQTVDRAVILQRVWKNDTYFNARSMDVYITKLRKYIKDDPNVKLANQHGVGFRLVVLKSSSSIIK